MKYKQIRTCASCGSQLVQKLTEREAAFVELRSRRALSKAPCPKCSSTEYVSISIDHLALTQSLLDEWGGNAELRFYEQDEAIIMAEPKYLPMILNGIDAPTYLPQKKRILVETLCVMLYDAIIDNEEYTEEENVERAKVVKMVVPELLKRKDRLVHPGQWIDRYVKAVVFPHIGLQGH